jgi:hypothetical protein
VPVWPPEVERVASLVRAAGIEARLEELPPSERHPPRPAVRAAAFDCDGRIVVALIPYGRDADGRKVAALAASASARPAPIPPFPFAAAACVFLDRLAVADRIVWVKLESPRHVLGLDPGELARLTRAAAADLIQDG